MENEKKKIFDNLWSDSNRYSIFYLRLMVFENGLVIAIELEQSGDKRTKVLFHPTIFFLLQG